MKAIVCQGTDGLHNLVFRDTPEPELRPRGVIIKMAGAGLNFPDVLQPQGLYQNILPTPFVSGLEFSGTVVEAGSECTKLKPGDRVMGLCQGAFAPYMSAPEKVCFSVPEAVDLTDAAALPLSGGTAMLGLAHYGRPHPGETLVVAGASGGTGHFAVQIGKAMKMRVIALCSTAAKADIARQAGADGIILTGTDDISQALTDTVGRNGIDIAYDPVGGDIFDHLRRHMAVDGRLLTVGYASGRIPKLSINRALMNSWSLIGVNWSTTAWNRRPLAERIIGLLLDLVGSGAVRPPITRRIPLAETIDAIHDMQNRRSTGKILVDLSSSG